MSDPGDTDLVRRWQVLEQQPALRRSHPATLRAAWWAWRAVRKARRELAQDGLAASVHAPPPVPWGGRTGVYGVLARTEPTCLERCLVQQTWLSAHGLDTTVLIGVRRGAEGKVAAHAWIDEAASEDEYEGYTVIHRLGPRRDG